VIRESVLLLTADCFRYGQDDQKKILLGDSREMYDEEDVSERIIIFGVPAMEGALHLVKHLYVDGTFGIKPKIPLPKRAKAKRKSKTKFPATVDEALEDVNESGTKLKAQKIAQVWLHRERVVEY
jgi:hypothetical protein